MYKSDAPEQTKEILKVFHLHVASMLDSYH